MRGAGAIHVALSSPFSSMAPLPWASLTNRPDPIGAILGADGSLKQGGRTLTDAWPDLAGRLTPRGHLLAVRVYFEDTDFSGVVYHANFLKFMERARSDMLRLLGVDHAALDDGAYGERLAFAVARIDIAFRKPARIDDVVEIETAVVESAGVRLVLEQTVRRGGESLVDAKVTVVMVNAAGRPRKMPEALRDKLVSRFRSSSGLSASSERTSES